MRTPLPLLAVVAFSCVFGCSSRDDETRLDRARYTEDVCLLEAGGRWSPLAGVTLADPERYLELVVATTGVAGDTRQTVSSTGTRCATADDAAACAKAIQDAVVADGAGFRTELCGGAGCTLVTRWFVTEKAGEVAVVARVEDLVPLVAPIDSAAEAVLVAAFGHDHEAVDCSGPQVAAGADGSYDVFLGRGDGRCTDRVESRVHVSSTGDTTVVETATTPARETCVSP